MKPAVEAGVFWGLSALGGYPGWVFLNACFAGLWAVGRWGCPESSGSRRPALRHVVGVLGIMTFVGLIILLPSYVPFVIEGSSYSDRAGVLTREVATRSNALHPGTLATFASPYLSILKLEGNQTLWEYTDISTSSIYLGVSVPMLALVALVGGFGNRWRLWIAFIVLLVIGCALARSLPLRGWLYDFVPPTRYFRHAGMLRVYAMFGVLVLALVGARDLASPRSLFQISRRAVMVTILLSAAACVAYYAVVASVESHGSKFTLATAHLGTMWPGIVAVLLIGRTIGDARRNRVVSTAMLVLAAADALLTAKLSADTISERGGCRAGWRQIDSGRKASLDQTPRGLGRELRWSQWSNKNLPLKIPTLDNYAPFADRFHLDFIQRRMLAATALGADRIWFSRNAAMVHPTDASYAAFVGRTEQLGQAVLVVHHRDWLLSRTRPGDAGPNDARDVAAIGVLPAAERVKATLVAYHPNELKLEIACQAAGWILVTDRWAPGWRTTVNGTPTELWGGNFIFRALAVREGKNEVHFKYHAVGFPALVLVSWMTIAAVMLWTGLAWLRSPDRSHPTGPYSEA